MTREFTTSYESGDSLGSVFTSGTGTQGDESTIVIDGIAARNYTGPADTDRAYTLHSIGAAQPEVFIRYYFRFDGTFSADTAIRSILMAIASSGSVIGEIRLHANGGSPELRLYRGSTQYGTSHPVVSGVWYCVEFHCIIVDPGNDTIEWRVDGVDRGGNTFGITSSNFISCRFGGQTDAGTSAIASMTFYNDAIAINSNTGGINDSWVGLLPTTDTEGALWLAAAPVMVFN